MDEAVTVRPADLDAREDAEHIIALTDAYARDPMGGGEPLPKAVRDRLVPAMREHGGTTVFLAFAADGDAVGILTAVKSFSTFVAGPVLNIHDIAVLPAHRGRGVGGLLIAEAEAWARQQGWQKATLEVLADNRAKHLYERGGYEAHSEFWTKRL